MSRLGPAEHRKKPAHFARVFDELDSVKQDVRSDVVIVAAQ